MDLNDYQLDVLGQQSGLKIYTQICLCFAVADASSHSAIINTLTNGLERLSGSFPWVAGQVVNEGSGEGSPCIFKIKPLENISPLVMKDLRHDPSIPTMNALRLAHFPFSMLDESIIAPRRTLPGSPDESPSDSTPVFLLQANFITGGLLLTFVGQHNTMDMTGQGQIIHLLSKACRNEQFTSEEVSAGNLDRRNIIPLLDDSYKQGSELDYQLVKPSPSHSIPKGTDGKPPPPPPPPPPQCTWTYFTFTATSLAALKAIATKTLPPPSSSSYISTDDALSAYIWQSITRARLPRLNPPHRAAAATTTTLARAVDVRRHLHLPTTYAGLMQNMTYHTSPPQTLLASPLGAIAARLRTAVDPTTSTLEYDTRALATFLSRSRAADKDEDKDDGVVSFTATLDLSADIMLSSWAKLDCYALDFGLGLGGGPEAVRRPRFVPVESLVYLMPRTSDGEIAVAVCLSGEDLEGLRADEEFMGYARFVG